MEFFMPMIPPTITAQEHKIAVVRGKPKFYNPPELEEAKDKITASLIRHKPIEMYTTAIRLVAKWCFPKGRHKDGEYKYTKPDTDNLNKLLKDCMTKCKFWKDDALVASEICEKFWADIPGIYIKIEKLQEYGGTP